MHWKEMRPHMCVVLAQGLVLDVFESFAKARESLRRPVKNLSRLGEFLTHTGESTEIQAKKMVG